MGDNRICHVKRELPSSPANSKGLVTTSTIRIPTCIIKLPYFTNDQAKVHAHESFIATHFHSMRNVTGSVTNNFRSDSVSFLIFAAVNLEDQAEQIEQSGQPGICT